jgi:hypothetical protein
MISISFDLIIFLVDLGEFLTVGSDALASTNQSTSSCRQSAETARLPRRRSVLRDLVPDEQGTVGSPQKVRADRA